MNIRKGDLLKLKKELCTLAVSFPMSKLAAVQTNFNNNFSQYV